LGPRIPLVASLEKAGWDQCALAGISDGTWFGRSLLELEELWKAGSAGRIEHSKVCAAGRNVSRYAAWLKCWSSQLARM